MTLAWSTPGAALLAASGTPDGGWPAAVGGFLGAGLLLSLTGLVLALDRLMARIPTSLAQAILAGVLLQLCLAPFKALGTVPALGTLASATSAALADPDDRIAPAVMFLTAASGLAFAGIGSAFWALVAGLAVRAALVRRQGKERPAAAPIKRAMPADATG